MWLFRGSINGVVDSQPKQLPMEVQSFSLVNVSGSNINVNVYMINSNENITVAIAPYGGQIATNGIYESARPVGMNIGDKIRVQSTGSVDYCFTIENLEAPYSGEPT